MRSGDELFEAAVLTVLLVVLVALAMGSARADAMPTHYQGARIDRAAKLTLARMVAGETGPDDLLVASAQVGVIARRAATRGVSLSTMASQYSAALRRPARPWILELADAERPPSFPRRASWRSFRVRFRILLRHIEAQIAGDIEDPCPDAVHFGSLRLDGHRMSAWDRVCPEVHSRQAFWGRR